MMAKYKTSLVVILLLFCLSGYSQQSDNLEKVNVLPAKVVDGDTLFLSYIEPVFIFPGNEREARKAARKYYRLIYNVKKVYPYAILARDKLEELNEELMALETDKERREFLKDYEKQMLGEYEHELKKLTITQGRILIKLIDRETGDTSYKLVKELRGDVSAVFWQTLARLFGSNLKSEYDANGEDRAIEEIVVMIESGQL